MLAICTSPLSFGLFLYHIYLIWAGMTTNESFKWGEWRDDVTDGFVFKDEGANDWSEKVMSDPEIEPFVDWPISSTQRLWNKANRDTPDLVDIVNPRRHHGSNRQTSRWRRVEGMWELENVYDLGFSSNLKDIFRAA